MQQKKTKNQCQSFHPYNIYHSYCVDGFPAEVVRGVGGGRQLRVPLRRLQVHAHARAKHSNTTGNECFVSFRIQNIHFL